jgi:hypothetical protein
MAIYEVSGNGFNKLTETTFGAEKFYERRDLQRLLKANIEVLSADLLVIAEEFGDWSDSSRRIDLLCLDKEACLVVIEIKRTEDGGHMELQAIRYAAMISTMTFSQLVEAHAAFLRKGTKDAEDSILSFLGWDEPSEETFASEVKIILASGDFSRELTTSVIWLNQHDIDIRCVRLKPYRLENGKLLVDVQQIIPLPEASDYQTRIRAKEGEGRQQRAERHDLRFKFWTGLLEYAKAKTTLHAQRSPTVHNWIGGSAGKRGFSLNYGVREYESQVDLYIDFGTDHAAKNLEVFTHFLSEQIAIEQDFGEPLDWQDLPDSRSCRIRKVVEGGYRTPSDAWPDTFAKLVDAMIRLDKTFKPHVQKLGV